MDNIIRMDKVRKNYKETQALKNLTFHVKKGEVFGFLGPSGAGKTTTIKLLTSQLLPTAGEVEVMGQNIYENKKTIFQHVGILTDNSGLYERLSVWDNLLLFADIYGVSQNNVTEILERVSMRDAVKKEVRKLSKGMKQRLLLARAVLHKPKLLFLDEPTSSLDPGTSQEIHGLLKNLNNEGTTIFLTTHNMEEADKLCNRVAFLNEGQIVEMGNPEDLKLKYITDDIQVILKDDTKKIFLKNNRENGDKIKNWMEEGQLLSIHTLEPSLEKIFLNLTGREL